MISLRQINALPAPERDRCYLSLVPPAFCERFGLDPLAFTDPQGRRLASVEAPREHASVRLSITHRAGALDPAFFLRLDESRYGNLQITLCPHLRATGLRLSGGPGSDGGDSPDEFAIEDW